MTIIETGATAPTPTLIREVSEAFVSKVGANAAPWQHWSETVSAVLEAIERAGYRVVPAVSADIPLRIFKEAARGR